MVTQDFLSNLWGRYNLTYKNVGIFETDGTMTPRASTTLTPQESNPVISTGGYRAPVQIVNVLPPMIKPRYRESNEMNPLEQKEKNFAMEKIQTPDPRINKTGKAVKTGKRLENMDIQITPFNYTAIAGVIGILVAIALIVFITKRGK
tara:strand:+ start:109 stop:552 length:444 start_codon:yes stop_codon:yes gene_type:complete